MHMSQLRASTSLRLPARQWKAARVSFRPVVRTFASSGQAVTDATSSSAAAKPNWEIKMLYDGDCPLCMREVDMLRRRDAGVGKIDFVDISSPDYRAEDNGGISFQEAMERIHAVLPDGTVVKDVEVFRRCYEAVGLGWVYAITKYEPVLKAANAVYSVWAKYRLPVTGRPDLEVVLQQKKMCRATGAAAGAAEQAGSGSSQ